MAERRPLHQQFPFRSGLETGGQAFNPPLLPYEKSLIETLGCTEEEYKTLVRHAMLRQRVRPAEYDHIPDIVNDPVTAVVVNIVVGLLFTAASVLLAPKPPSFEDNKNKKITGKKLADQIGPSSFNQSTSFDNSPSLAELNSPIPIPFGRRDRGADNLQTGGLIFVPALVWSRIYAYGTYQAFEGVYVAGEAGVTAPDLGGILLGTSALSALGNRDFALYWSSKAGNNRPINLQYGTEGSSDSGTVGRKVFTAPIGAEPNTDNFSMSYVPSGDTTFGTSTPIHNGTIYKFNWEVISAPKSGTTATNARLAIRAKRRKIAGAYADFLHDQGASPYYGMPGEGRAYSRHMGFMRVKRSGDSTGTTYTTKADVQNIGLDDIAIFEIDKRNNTYADLGNELFESADIPSAGNRGFQYPHRAGFGGYGVGITDLISSAEGWRNRASDLLTIGSRWICGGVVWLVFNRTEDPSVIHIHMKCVAQTGGSTLGVPGLKTINEGLGGYEGIETSPYGDVYRNPDKFVDNSYFNLCKLHVATVRPIRREADAIEIGIRSQVWNKASGLCNFNDIPKPSDLRSWDVSNLSVTNGRMDKYFLRSSCFNVWVRPVAGAGQSQDDTGFQQINQLFCVQGSAPTKQNNFLRIRPKTAGYYEYRLIPRTGSDIVHRFNQGESVIILQASEGVPYSDDKVGEITVTSNSSYGNFEFTTQGKTTNVAAILHNSEFDVQGRSFNSARSNSVEPNSQIADCSYYSEIQKSNDSGPEHEVSYINEYVSNKTLAKYDDMTTVGFAVKSSGEISGIEQLRLCCSNGITVERLERGYKNLSTLGLKFSSNNFADLVYYLLTSKTQGVGNIVPAELVDKDSLKTTADFLNANRIYYDGVIEDSESFRSFLYDTAPLQLCSFTIKNGKFGMQPALPYFKTEHDDGWIQAGQINATEPISVEQIFTAGNIIEDSFQLQYIDLSQRSNIRAVVTWRVTQENDLPYQASALLYWADLSSANTTEQSFDLSEFCTNKEQALRTARFLMSTRRRVTKTVSFKTAPDALSVQPGSYIRVMTEASVYNADGNGRIGEAGKVTSFVDIENGTYDALLYGSADQEVIEAKIAITNGIVQDQRFYGYLFSLLTSETDYSVYQIDSLNLEEDGLVSISAVEVPTDENGHSIVAKDVLDASNDIFRVVE